jgi:hypothetical protein
MRTSAVKGIEVAGKSDDKLMGIETSQGGTKLAWTRPAVQRMHAGAAEEGQNTAFDFGQSKS